MRWSWSDDALAPSMERAQVLALIPTFIVVAVDATGIESSCRCYVQSQRLGTTLSSSVLWASVLIVSQIGTSAGFVLFASAGNLTPVFLARIKQRGKGAVQENERGGAIKREHGM
jgi:hypothetical protein